MDHLIDVHVAKRKGQEKANDDYTMLDPNNREVAIAIK